MLYKMYSMPRIGFDAKRLFFNNTGLGNYSRTLVDNLQFYYPDSEYVLFSTRKSSNDYAQKFLNDDYEQFYSQAFIKSFWRSKGIVKDIQNQDLDIYHGLSHELPFGIDKTDAISIVTIHDLIYKFYKKDFSAIDRYIYHKKFTYSCKVADHIIAISESTKNDIVKHFGIDEKKISVVYQSCDQSFKKHIPKEEIADVKRKYNLPEQYLLFVGSVIYRKNVLAIVKALKEIKSFVKIPLVIVGGGNKYLQEIKQYIEQNDLKDLVYFPPYISNEFLPAVYRGAKLFIYPSKYEGFGIPIIEAMYSRTPVILSNISSLPEAAGDGGYYIDPEKPETIAEGIIKLLTDKDFYVEKMNRGFQYVQKFNKSETAKSLMDVYEKCLYK